MRQRAALHVKQVKWLALGTCMVRDGYEDARILGIDLSKAGKKALRDHYRLRNQMSTTKGLLDIPGFDRVIDKIGDWANG